MPIVKGTDAQSHPKSDESPGTAGGDGSAPKPPVGPPPRRSKTVNPATPDLAAIKARIEAFVASGDLGALYADEWLLDGLAARYSTPEFYELINLPKVFKEFKRENFIEMIRYRKEAANPAGRDPALD